MMMSDDTRGQNPAPQGSALEQFLAEVTPINWSYIPVDSNKATYIAGWNDGGLSRQEVERRYLENYHLREGQIEKFPGATEYAFRAVPDASAFLLPLDRHQHCAWEMLPSVLT